MTKIGIIDLASDTWTAGGAYSKVSAESLARTARNHPSVGEIFFIGPADRKVEGTRHIRRGAVTPLPLERTVFATLGRAQRRRPLRGEGQARRALGLSDPADPVWLAEQNALNALFPVTTVPRWTRRRRVGLLGWIPDLQHLQLPELFTAAQLEQRRKAVAIVAARCESVVFSSQTVNDEFCELLPEYGHKARVLHFPSRFAFSALQSNPAEVIEHYNLPERFLLCANQFWAHKNHALLIDALGLLRRRGISINVVMTGLPLDYRSETNEPTSRLLRSIATNGVAKQVSVLGLVPSIHLEALIRGAEAVVQPSLHEGWSTTVQDAKALGRPLVCSDLRVLREQAPTAKFFRPTVSDLADALEATWAGDVAPVAEEVALLEEKRFAAEHGEKLIRFCQEVAV